MLRIVYIMAGTPTRAPNNLQVSCHPRPEDDMQPLGLFPRCPVTGPAAPFPSLRPSPWVPAPQLEGSLGRRVEGCQPAPQLPC